MRRYLLVLHCIISQGNGIFIYLIFYAKAIEGKLYVFCHGVAAEYLPII